MNKSHRLLYLLENMSVDSALDVLGLSKSDIGDTDKIKKAFRAASRKAHPDTGGSDEAIKKVISAYELLGKTKTSAGGIDWDKLNKEYRDLADVILKDLLKRFDLGKYTAYFEKVSGLKFKGEIVSKYPEPKDQSPHYAGFKARFSTADNDYAFDLSVYVTLSKIKHGGSLGGSHTYDLSTTAYGFAHNRKQKMSQSDYSSKNESVFSDPSLAFPEAKMKKIFGGKSGEKKQFKRADFALALKNYFNATQNSDYTSIPLSGEYRLVIYRSTFNRYATWGFNGLYKKFGRVSMLATAFFPETEATLDSFKHIVAAAKKETDEDDMIKALNTAIKAEKEKIKYD